MRRKIASVVEPHSAELKSSSPHGLLPGFLAFALFFILSASTHEKQDRVIQGEK